jgi:hypothetical protein
MIKNTCLALILLYKAVSFGAGSDSDECPSQKPTIQTTKIDVDWTALNCAAKGKESIQEHLNYAKELFDMGDYVGTSWQLWDGAVSFSEEDKNNLIFYEISAKLGCHAAQGYLGGLLCKNSSRGRLRHTEGINYLKQEAATSGVKASALCTYECDFSEASERKLVVKESETYSLKEKESTLVDDPLELMITLFQSIKTLKEVGMSADQVCAMLERSGVDTKRKWTHKT